MNINQAGLSYHDTDDDSVRNYEERHPDIAMDQVAFDDSHI